jgi:hypothetical protein
MKIGAQYISGLAHALTDVSKIISGDKWCADVKERTLTYNRETTDPDTIRALTLHEIGHLKHTEPYHTELEKTSNKSQAIRSVYNSLEDIRIEHLLGREYGGFSNYLLNANMRQAIMEQDWSKADPLRRVLSGAMARMKFGSSHSATKTIDCSSNEEEKTLAQSVSETINPCEFRTYKELADRIDRDIIPLLEKLLPENSEQQEEESAIKRRSSGPGGRPLLENIPVVSYLDCLATAQPYINVLSTKINQVLKETKQTRIVGQHKSGILASKNVYKIANGETRVFSKRSRPDTPNYNVILLLDNSGSMRDTERLNNAMTGAAILESVFSKIGMKPELWSYDNDCRRIESITEWETPDGGNYELNAFERIIARLKKTGTNNNLLIMLTDGQGDDWPTMRPAIDELENKLDTKIMVIGIGSEASDVVHNYPNRHIYMPKVEELPSAVIRYLKDLFKR